jgi:hypothetical protein
MPRSDSRRSTGVELTGQDEIRRFACMMDLNSSNV